MTRQKFFTLFGEYPEDVLGADWENYVDEYLQQVSDNLYGDIYGQA